MRPAVPGAPGNADALPVDLADGLKNLVGDKLVVALFSDQVAAEKWRRAGLARS